MVTGVVVEFGVMRCQPLRRALKLIRSIYESNNKETALRATVFT
ncbi:acetyltransferase [Vibrio cholerae]